MTSTDHSTAAPLPSDSSHLCLYVAGQSPKSLLAIANLKRLCEAHVPGHYEIETVDLVEHPTRAQDDDIVAIPTLVLRHPPPPRRVIGDLSDAARVVAALHLGGDS